MNFATKLRVLRFLYFVEIFLLQLLQFVALFLLQMLELFEFRFEILGGFIGLEDDHSRIVFGPRRS